MDEYKKVVFPKQHFLKKELQIWEFESFIVGSKFRFLGGQLKGVLASDFFFGRRPTMVADNFCQSFSLSPASDNIEIKFW